jgi:RNA polymerase sigma-70 factor (ECF subfamily)
MSKPPVLREEAASASVESLDDARRRQQLADLALSHRTYLEGLARRLCRHHLDPDDLVQDVFERAFRAARPIPEGVNVRAWLSRVLHNLFIDKLRRRAARREDPLDEPVVLPSEDHGAWWHSLTIEEIRATLARLPEDQRVTFELFAFDGKSYDAIASTLGIAKATVGTRILRARQKLRELLTEERGDA